MILVRSTKIVGFCSENRDAIEVATVIKTNCVLAKIDGLELSLCGDVVVRKKFRFVWTKTLNASPPTLTTLLSYRVQN